MVAPLVIAAGISAISSLASGALSTSAAGDASSTNLAINQANLNAGERERLHAQFVAAQIRAEQKLGTTDAFGNRTRFVPGEGVVSTASPDIQRLIDASNFEEEQRLTGDAARARDVREDATDLAGDSKLAADSLLQEFLRQGPSVGRDVERELNSKTSRGFNEGFDDAQNNALIQALRQGTGSDTISNAIQVAGDQRGTALARLLTENSGRAEAIKGQRDDRSGTANLFNSFATRATGAPSSPAAPSTAGNAANSLLALFANRSAQGDALAFNAANRVGGRADFVTPDFSTAAGIGQGGEALASLFSALPASIFGGKPTDEKRGLQGNKVF